MLVFIVFFFKQKTAYEMRISDWSSDVCSSDLFIILKRRRRYRHRSGAQSRPTKATSGRSIFPRYAARYAARHAAAGVRAAARSRRRPRRSAEHTSELQSLMRISYAVFCLKTQQATDNYNSTHSTTLTLQSIILLHS